MSVAPEPGPRLAAEAAYVAGPSLSFGRLLWRRFLEHHLAVFSLILLALLVIATFAAPLAEQLLGLDAETVDLFNQKQPPSPEHPLGTDELGRDLLLRLLYGGQVSLLAGLVTAVLAAAIGTAIGLLAGYFGGILDAVLMRLTDGVIALPLLPLLIVLAAVDLTKLGLPETLATSEEVSLYRIIILIALVGWTTVARLVRGSTLSLREREFVRAARGARRPAAADHAGPHPAQRDLAGHRRDHPFDRQHHPAGIGPQLPGPRHPAADSVLGQHADRRPGPDLGRANACGLARHADLRHRDRLQLPGRRAPGRSRPSSR